jgi:glucosamine--fructose-6-phosphate aminotransferase (isomerizing)
MCGIVAAAANQVIDPVLIEKLKKMECRSYVLADIAGFGNPRLASCTHPDLPEHFGELSPNLHVIPLQFLSNHTALVKGTDVDKPRNLAKSVTVE